jgi:AcrR family transcriptional regulator
MPGRLDPESRRQEILTAAARSIIEHGLHATRVADIARRAGVSSGLVAHYFPTKDSLLAEALINQDTLFYEQLEERLQGGGSARQRLVMMIETACPPSAGARVNWALWLELWSAARLDPALAATRNRLDGNWRKAIAATIRRGQREGEFEGGNPAEVALRLAALIDGLALQVALGDRAVTPAKMRATCLKAAAAELGFKL